MKKRNFTSEERSRLYGVCYRGKRGKISAEDSEFARKMFGLNEKEYGKISREAACEAMNSVGGRQFEVVDDEIKEVTK